MWSSAISRPALSPRIGTRIFVQWGISTGVGFPGLLFFNIKAATAVAGIVQRMTFGSCTFASRQKGRDQCWRFCRRHVHLLPAI